MADSKIKVLLVEDDADDYIITRDLLREAEAAKFALDWVQTYEAALEAMSRQEHDVYLLDYRLGARTGLDFLQEAISNGCDAPIILLTGQGDRETDVAAMQAGAADYLVKHQLSAPLMERSIRHALERKQSQQAMRESETRFRTVVESLGEGLLITDLQDVILYANSRVQELTGYTNEELIGQPGYKLLLPPEKWPALEQRNRQRQQGIAEQYEMELRAKEGQFFWALINATPFCNTAGEIIGTLGALTDITERKRAEAALQQAVHENSQLAAAVNNLTTAVIITDPNLPDNPIIFVNPGFTVITGYTADEVIGRNCRFLQGPATDSTVVKRIRAAVTEARTYKGELINYTKAGKPFWNSLTINPIFDKEGKVINFVGLSSDVTARRQAADALHESEARLRFMTETSSGALYERKYDGTTFDYMSPAITKLTGYSPAEINAIGIRNIILKVEGDITSTKVDPETRERAKAKGEFQADYQIRTKGGELRWLSDHSVAWRDGQQNLVGWVGILSDITERKAAEARQRSMTQGLQAVLVAADELLVCPDMDDLLRRAVELGREKLGLERCGISLMTEDGQTMTGAFGTNMQGETTDERDFRFAYDTSWFQSSSKQPQPDSPLALASTTLIRSTRWVCHPDQPFRDWDGQQMVDSGKTGWIAATPIQSTQGMVGIFFNDNALSGTPFDEIKQEMVAVFCSLLGNIIERKRAEQQLSHNAFYDALTNLPNRSLFMERLDRAIKRRKRHHEYLFAVLFLDLDRFKNVNDSLGHSVGDDLLVAAARRLEKCLRTEDTVARLGGDEFTILLDDIRDMTEATHVAERIQQELGEPFNLHGTVGVEVEWFASVSIGIAIGAQSYERAEEVLRDADIAMYRAKTQGKARHEIFDVAMHERAQALLQLEADLWRALEREEFLLHYQPIIDLSTGQLFGFEALVRWQHPQRGMVSPMEFIPIMEDNGLILPLGQWVLRESCRQMREWQNLVATAQSLVISVNVSSKQFSQTDLVEQVQRALKETGLAASQLKLEITESVIMHNASSAAAMLAELKALGLQVSIDDFGTGYSSLNSLHLFPLDTLKVDRSFVLRLGPHGENKEIVETIVALARHLGMEVIAEGIETPEHLTQLRALECAYGQGYFFAKPLTPEAATAYIMANFTTQERACSVLNGHHTSPNGNSVMVSRVTQQTEK